jgi:RNA polymerase sigma-70 factor, ECF subfamily
VVDDAAFSALLERHRGELRVHCYRMLGSFEDSEDLVQETFLRAWRGRSGFRPEGEDSLRAWLYRIATNACLDFLAARPRRVLPVGGGPAEVAWLQPYPDRLLDAGPDAAVVGKETIELVLMVAIQHLPPRQRAVLILRDLLGWSAKQTAGMLEASVAAVNSALQRARETVKAHLPERRAEWAQGADPTESERVLLRGFVEALERADAATLTALLAAHARLVMPPLPTWWEGRDAIVDSFVEGPFQPEFGQFRVLATRANRQPAAACYLRRPGASQFLPLGIDVLRSEDGVVVDVLSFSSQPLGPQFSEAAVPDLFGAFGLPPALER